MRKLLISLFVALALQGGVQPLAHAESFLRPYGVAATINFKLYNADGTLDVDEVDGGTEVSVSCNEGAQTTATNDFVDEGDFYSIALTATEMQCARMAIVIAATTTEVVFVTTYGPTSSTITALPVAAAGASGGLPTGNGAGEVAVASGGANLTAIPGVNALLEALITLGAEQTADSGTTTTLVDAALTQGTNDWFAGQAVVFTSGTLLGQTSCLTGFTAASDTLTFSPAVTTAVTTHTYYILPAGRCQTGDSFARIGANGSSLTSLASQASLNTVDDFLDTEVAAILAAVDTEVAAILDDTGTSGVVIAEATGNCREVLGCDTQGTLNGTHSTTTADLGANAPTNDITGMTLIVPTHNFARVISSYNTGTGVATWTEATAATLANSNQYYLYATAPGSGGGGGGDATEAKQDTILANLAVVDGIVDAILVDTGSTLDDMVDDLETRLTATRSGYLDKLNITGNVANQGSVDTIDGIVDSILDDTGTTGVLIASGESTEIQAAANAALVANHLDHLLATAYDPASKPGAADALLNELVGNDGGVAQFTANALELGPAGGGGGSSDWNADERAAIRAILGVPGSGSAPADPVTGILDTIRDSVATRASQASVDDVPTNSELSAALASADDTILAALATLNDVSVTQIRDAVVEDQGAGVTRGCVEAVLLAYAAGDVSTTGNTTTWRDPSNGEARIVGTLTSNGNRTATITCPTY